MIHVWSKSAEAWLRSPGDETHDHIWDNRFDHAKGFKSYEELGMVQRFLDPTDVVIVQVVPYFG